MKIFPQLTIGTCSYNTPLVTITMLKSLHCLYGDFPSKLLVSENSTNEETVKFLEQYNIPYIRNPGSIHSKGVDSLIENCKTKVLLLVDTDIVFIRKFDPLFKRFIMYDVSLMGNETGDRGDFKLKKRIDPWFCFINVEHIKSEGIKFHDQEKIDLTNSHNFFKNIPDNSENKFNLLPFYDVGSSFYEDVKNANLFIANVPSINSFYIHYEGSSWQINSSNENYKNFGLAMQNEYQKEILFYNNYKLEKYFD